MLLNHVEILSSRLRQIPIQLDYAQDIFKNFTDEITTYMYPKSANKIEETIDFINSSIGGINQGSNLQLVVLDKKTGEFLGCSGLHRVDTNTPELGIWIKKSAHHNRYGIEAINAIVDWAKQNINFEYIKYPVDKRNFASRRIPEKHHGTIQKKFKHINMSGNELDVVEYWIYK